MPAACRAATSGNCGGRGPGRPRAPDETDLDHDLEFRDPHDNGITDDIDNLVLLSPAHHLLKSEGVLAMHLLPNRTLVIEASSGHRWVTRPHDPIGPTPVPAGLVFPEDAPF